MSLEEAIARRRSIRHFTSETLSQSQLSQILWSAQGTTDSWGRYRTVPSAGATYPLEIFVVCGKNCIKEIGDGIYHYNIDSHSLTLHHKGDIRLELARVALDQEFIYQAPVDIIICALYQRTTLRYDNRGERYVHVLIAGIGTGGTIVGVSQRLKEKYPNIRVIGVEPPPDDNIQGLRCINSGQTPPILDLSLITERAIVTSRQAAIVTRQLLEKEGIFAGLSSGAVVHQAIKVANEMDEGNIVVVLADGGWKYLSLDFWTKAK